MSIKDKVGESSSFGRTRNRSERGRAKALTEGAIPAYELVRLPLDQVAATPLNPRRNFGSAEEMTRFGEELREAQLAACVAVTRAAYLKLWPDHESQIGSSALYVLVNGERRFRSGVHVGLDKLDFVVRDDLAATREDFVDHLLAENLDREDFDVIERARGVEQLVSVCAEDGGERGSRSRAAKRLGKDRSWVTNQLALLTLPVQIQVLLSAGEVSERDGRALARCLKEDPGLGAEELLGQLASAKQTAEQRKQEEQRLLAAGREALAEARPAETLSADNKPSSDGSTAPATAPAPAQAAGAGASLLSADNNDAATTSQKDTTSRTTERQTPAPPVTARSDSVPEPREEHLRSEPPQRVTGVRFPYDNAVQAAQFLYDRMDDSQFLILVDTLNGMVEERRNLGKVAAE
ncbi:plasmid partitioning protein [Streptomyces sp. SID2563]|uniref:ParB/RepB/Spo0J family partition protein n=1 Tax=Streptomyces sp. SID2563 TaxID=2690255 RepID=UPI001369DCA9|nr:plasmid partitioning protein [Streptomyces sp. SID2563]MYW08600.1 plasmid partitioning protein [Streptomyces sp. SID2563]